MTTVNVATDFEKIINAGRDRKKNEALAARIFSKDRRASGSPKPGTPSGSLASRAGIRKRVSSTGPRASPGTTATPAGNIDGEWTHDLHEPHARSAPATPTADGSLASRTTNPLLARRQQQRRAARVAEALISAELLPGDHRTVSTPQPPPDAAGRRGITIRGLAGPYAIMAQNFAPGTTAADIESAMTPVGGLISQCRILKTSPIVIAEIVFESREGADEVIATFNNQTADGRILHVYHKASASVVPAAAAGGNAAATSQQDVQRQPPRGPRSDRDRDDMLVDGTMGFDDPMDADDNLGRSKGDILDRPSQQAVRGRDGSLYSDNMVRSNQRARDFGRGGRRGGGGGGGGGGRW